MRVASAPDLINHLRQPQSGDIITIKENPTKTGLDRLTGGRQATRSRRTLPRDVGPAASGPTTPNAPVREDKEYVTYAGNYVVLVRTRVSFTTRQGGII